MISAYYPQPNKYKPRVKYQGNHHTSANSPIYPITAPSGYSVGFIESEAKKLNITPYEWSRRNTIVQDLSRACPFRAGDTFYPCNKEGYEMYGKCYVQHKAITYMDISRDNWPSDDLPWIITAKSLIKDADGKERIFLAVTSYLSKDAPIA